MTPFPLPSGRVLNLANVTYAERATWTVSPHAGELYFITGVIVHFIGGTRLKLEGTDAIVAAKELGL